MASYISNVGKCWENWECGNSHEKLWGKYQPPVVNQAAGQIEPTSSEKSIHTQLYSQIYLLHLVDGRSWKVPCSGNDILGTVC